MDEMLAYVDKLNELDTKDVAPTTQVGEAGTPMRDDEVMNAPARKKCWRTRRRATAATSKCRK